MINQGPLIETEIFSACLGCLLVHRNMEDRALFTCNRRLTRETGPTRLCSSSTQSIQNTPVLPLPYTQALHSHLDHLGCGYCSSWEPVVREHENHVEEDGDPGKQKLGHILVDTLTCRGRRYRRKPAVPLTETLLLYLAERWQ